LSDRSGEVDSEGRPRRKRSLLDVPANSNEDPSSATTALSGDTIKDSEGSIGRGSRGSKRSLTGKKRAGSRASSKRSQRGEQMANEKQTEATPGSGSPTTLTEASPKKGVSRFFSLLCCGLPRGGTVGDDDEKPAKKTTKVLPDRTSIPPAQKHDVNTAESSTADSKEPLSEKPQEPQYAQDTRVINEKAEPPAPPGESSVDKQPTPEISAKPNEAQIPIDQPLLPVPTQPTVDTNVAPESSSVAGPHIAVQAPTPIVSPEEDMIHDRTPEQEQRDSDIEMTDAGPSVPIGPNDVSGTSEDAGPQPVHKDASAVKIDLPPPPPLADRRAQVHVTPPQTPEAAASGHTEEPKWLLPPITPEHKGKKCLVLDLDETLVHSSFKVCRPCSPSICALTHL
jgi:carboxy-terminal domain RNA polymerase II polypeptide A small phosphatase